MVAGDLANLDTRHMSHGRPTPKLDYRWTAPHEVEALQGGSAKLSLPASSKIHLTVNLSYHRRFENDQLPGQVTEAGSPNPVVAGEERSQDKFEVTCILVDRMNRQ